MPAVLNRFRLITGIIIWIAVLGLASYYGRVWFSESRQTTDQLQTFLFTTRQQIEIEFEKKSLLAPGDPIVVFDGESARVVGNVVQISPDHPYDSDADWTNWALIELFASAPAIRDGDFLSYHRTPDSMEWVVQMMLPPKTRYKIGKLIVEAYRKNHTEIAGVLQPIIVKSVQQAADVIRDEFNKSILQRDQQIQRLADRYQIELVDKELIPLIQDEIWPVIQKELMPLAMEIGEEIWEQASIWRFGWRFAYDRSPLPEKNLVQREFQRFLEKQGIPVIESHLPEMLAVQTEILRQVSVNEKVQRGVSNMARKVLRDPEFQLLASDMLRDVFVDNDRLTEVFEKNWNSQEARKAMQITNQKLDPTITEIGQALFGAPNTSITPEFSRVLRYKILNKDERWLVLHLTQPRATESAVPTTLSVIEGITGTENPFHVPKRTEY